MMGLPWTPTAAAPVLAAALLLAPVPGAAAQTPTGARDADGARPRLRHDLFSRPRPAESPALVPLPGGAVRAGGVAADRPSAAASQAAPAWRPPLRAVVMAGGRSMALVDRAVVELGESVDGYRLEAVSEDSAVFVRGRDRVVLYIGKVRDLE